MSDAEVPNPLWFLPMRKMYGTDGEQTGSVPLGGVSSLGTINTDPKTKEDSPFNQNEILCYAVPNKMGIDPEVAYKLGWLGKPFPSRFTDAHILDGAILPFLTEILPLGDNANAEGFHALWQPEQSDILLQPEVFHNGEFDLDALDATGRETLKISFLPLTKKEYLAVIHDRVVELCAAAAKSTAFSARFRDAAKSDATILQKLQMMLNAAPEGMQLTNDAGKLIRNKVQREVCLGASEDQQFEWAVTLFNAEFTADGGTASKTNAQKAVKGTHAKNGRLSTAEPKGVQSLNWKKGDKDTKARAKSAKAFLLRFSSTSPAFVEPRDDMKVDPKMTRATKQPVLKKRKVDDAKPVVQVPIIFRVWCDA